MKSPWLWFLLTLCWLRLASNYFSQKYAPKPPAVQLVERAVPPDTVFLPVPMAVEQPVFWEKTAQGYRVFFLDNATVPIVPPPAAALLKKLAQKAALSHQKVRLTGHTDDIDTDEFNLRLGENRALAVRKVLADAGMPEADIETDTAGETAPIAPNDSDSNRRRNRRVEIVFY